MSQVKRNPLWTIHDLLIPVAGMYAGQFLFGALPRSMAWGLGVMAISLALLFLRVRATRFGKIADATQVALGLVIGLPLALDMNGWKSSTPTLELFAVWFISIALVAFPVLRLKPQPIAVGLAPFERFKRTDLLLIALLIVGALLVRVPAIDTIPSGVDPDEASLAHSAADVAEGISKDPFSTGWATHPTLQFFAQGLFIRALGRTFLAMRLPSAIVGMLAVVAIYLLARVGFGQRVAAIAGVLALASDVAIHFSRLGINNITDSLFAPLVLAAFWFAGASGVPLGYLLTGAALGLSQYYYFGGRAIPVVLGVNLVVWLIADRRGVFRARYLLLAAFGVALVVVLPLLGHMMRNPGSISDHLFLTIPFSSRIQEDATRFDLSVAAIWWQRIVVSLLVIPVGPDSGSFYHSGQSMLHPLQVPFFLIGFFRLLSRWRQPFNLGLILWMLTTLTLGSVLITDPAAFHRLLGVLPAAIVVVAVGVVEAAKTFAGAMQLSPQMEKWLAASLVAAFAIVDVYYYFQIYNTQQAYKPPTQEAVALAALDYTRLNGQGEFVLFTHDGIDESGRIYHEAIRYVAGDAFMGGVPQNVDQLNTTQPLYLYVLPDESEELAPLAMRFPGGSTKEFRRSSDDLLLMTRYAVVPRPP